MTTPHSNEDKIVSKKFPSIQRATDKVPTQTYPVITNLTQPLEPTQYLFAKNLKLIKSHMVAEEYEISDYELGHLASMMSDIERTAEERGYKKGYRHGEDLLTSRKGNQLAFQAGRAEGYKKGQEEERTKLITHLQKAFEQVHGGGNGRRIFEQLIGKLSKEPKT